MLYSPAIIKSLISKKYIFDHEKPDNKKQIQATNNLVEIELFLPVKTDTLLAKKIALQTTVVSKYIDLSHDFSVNFTNKIFDGVSILDLKITACVFDILNKDLFVSDVTEMIFNQLLKQKIITQEDFYI